MIKTIEDYLKDKFGSVETIELSDKDKPELVKFIVNFRNLVITFLVDTKTGTIQIKLDHKESWEFKEFDDVDTFRRSITTIAETLEDLNKKIKDNKQEGTWTKIKLY